MFRSEKGYGKRSNVEGYRKTNRGGKGVKTLDISDKTGLVVAIKAVTDEEDLMIINKSGITIRLKLDKVPVQGRATQGVKLIELKKRNEEISSVCKVPTDNEEDEEATEGAAPAETATAEGTSTETATTESAPETTTEDHTTNAMTDEGEAYQGSLFDGSEGEL